MIASIELFLCNVKIFLWKKKKNIQKECSLLKKRSTKCRLNRINIFAKKWKASRYISYQQMPRDTCCYSAINVRNFHEIGCWNFVSWKQREEFDMEDLVEKKTTRGISSNAANARCRRHHLPELEAIIWTGSRDNTIFRGRRFPAITSRVFIEFRDVRGDISWNLVRSNRR